MFKKSPLRTTKITTIIVEEFHELADRIGLQRGTLGAVRYAKR